MFSQQTSFFCECFCGKKGMNSASLQQHVPKRIQSLDSENSITHCCGSARYFVMSNLVAYVDGGSLGNPGPAGIGLVIDGSEDGTIKIKKWIGHQDNNVAEYVALLEALQFALELGARALHVFSDSEVVVKQMTGQYTCRSTRLYSLHWTCRKLARSLEFSISHIPRENNMEANRLVSSVVKKRSR
jgi:ribonuclease HI